MSQMRSLGGHERCHDVGKRENEHEKESHVGLKEQDTHAHPYDQIRSIKRLKCEPFP